VRRGSAVRMVRALWEGQHARLIADGYSDPFAAGGVPMHTCMRAALVRWRSSSGGQCSRMIAKLFRREGIGSGHLNLNSVSVDDRRPVDDVPRSRCRPSAETQV